MTLNLQYLLKVYECHCHPFKGFSLSCLPLRMSFVLSFPCLSQCVALKSLVIITLVSSSPPLIFTEATIRCYFCGVARTFQFSIKISQQQLSKDFLTFPKWMSRQAAKCVVRGRGLFLHPAFQVSGNKSCRICSFRQVAIFQKSWMKAKRGFHGVVVLLNWKRRRLFIRYFFRLTMPTSSWPRRPPQLKKAIQSCLRSRPSSRSLRPTSS